MLAALLSLQYECSATLKVGGEKKKTGGECPDDVACAVLSTKQLEEAAGLSAGDASGKAAQCVAFESDVRCRRLCKVACKERDSTETYERTWLGETTLAQYFYYCPKGQEKYKKGLSGGAIAGIVIGCVVADAAIAAAISFIIIRRRRKCRHNEVYNMNARCDVVCEVTVDNP